MTGRKLGALVFFVFSSVVALIWGLAQAHSTHDVILDYRVMDLGARCLLQRADLYNESDMLRVYAVEDKLPALVRKSHEARYLATIQVYPPTAEIFFAPFALLPWPIAYCVWISITFGLVTLAAFLLWDSAQIYAPDPPFYFGCFVLVNSGILFAGGNPAGIAVSLCVIGFWCFFHQRFQWAGVFCIAVSLAIKPHDSGLVWLYVLMLGGTFRKQALRALAVATALGVPAILWISQVSPNWVEELRANLAELASAGSYNDPASGIPALIINLQVAIAPFHNDPRFYNTVTWIICTPLILLWIFITLRIRQTAKGIWLGVAVIASLSLLPLYHRPYDAKILLLTFPACAALWAERGMVAWVAIAFTGAGIFATSDLPVALFSVVGIQSHSNRGVISDVILLATRPAPLFLLGMSIFYLWAYARLLRSEKIGTAGSVELGTSN